AVPAGDRLIDAEGAPSGRLVVALVRGLHGIRGAVRVEVLTDRPEERFVVGARLHLEGSASGLTIVEARPAHPGWILLFDEIRTRAAAEHLRLAYLEVDAGPADALPRGAYFWHEMIGVAVRDPDGAPLGTVRDVYRAGGADVLEVVGGSRGAFDLPIIRPFVRILAPRRGEIVVDPEALDLPTADQIRPPEPPRPPRPRRATRRRPAVPAATPPDDAAPPDDEPPPEG
ncbi:MAG: ribosome maturation factor RimM, partial [Chloroflexota bacterium]